MRVMPEAYPGYVGRPVPDYGFLGVDRDFVPDELDREFYRTDDQPSRSLVPLWIRRA